jgi:cell division protein FtsL
LSRRWTLTGLGVLWVAVLASAVAVVRARGESRALFVELERLSAERDDLNIAWGRQQIEQSFWSNPVFVEQVAAKRGQMTFAKPDEVRIVSQ